jgi:hypothetical protein
MYLRFLVQGEQPRGILAKEIILHGRVPLRHAAQRRDRSASGGRTCCTGEFSEQNRCAASMAAV